MKEEEIAGERLKEFRKLREKIKQSSGGMGRTWRRTLPPSTLLR